MISKKIKLEWTEKHEYLSEYDVMDDGTIIQSSLGNAMDRAFQQTALFHRFGVMPETIRVTFVED